MKPEENAILARVDEALTEAANLDLKCEYIGDSIGAQRTLVEALRRILDRCSPEEKWKGQK